MNTPFGKFISGKFFSRLFFVLSVAGIVSMAAANAGAADQLLDKPVLTGAVFAVYLLVGILAVRLSKITLLGRTNTRNNYRAPLEDYFERTDWEGPVVAADHDPAGIPEAARMGVDLVLCGHTHKGRFFPATWFTKQANGNRFFYGHEIFGRTHAVKKC